MCFMHLIGCRILLTLCTDFVLFSWESVLSSLNIPCFPRFCGFSEGGGEFLATRRRSFLAPSAGRNPRDIFPAYFTPHLRRLAGPSLPTPQLFHYQDKGSQEPDTILLVLRLSRWPGGLERSSARTPGEGSLPIPDIPRCTNGGMVRHHPEALTLHRPRFHLAQEHRSQKASCSKCTLDQITVELMNAFKGSG